MKILRVNKKIIDKYKKEKDEMPTDLFFDFFKENLIQRHGVPESNADELAETIIAKKKTVKKKKKFIFLFFFFF